MHKTLYGNPENRMADDSQRDDEQGTATKRKNRRDCGELENWKPSEKYTAEKLAEKEFEE